MYTAIPIVVLFVALFGWFVLNIAVLLAPRVRRFSLRNLLIAITIAAPFIFLMTRLELAEAMLLEFIALAALFFAAVNLNYHSK
jgi:hypothetical protein